MSTSHITTPALGRERLPTDDGYAMLDWRDSTRVLCGYERKRGYYCTQLLASIEAKTAPARTWEIYTVLLPEDTAPDVWFEGRSLMFDFDWVLRDNGVYEMVRRRHRPGGPLYHANASGGL
jgi:hypothetical protein